MAGHQPRRALLGRLADLGWFARHGEVAATQALAVLLEEQQLRDALLRRLGQVTETDLGAVASFQAEIVHEDLGRPDLEGQDSLGRPLLVVEAKFGAALTVDQVRAYLSDQHGRLVGEVRGALVLLVPSYRKPEAEAVLRALENQADDPNASTPSMATAVVTWDEWLGVWNEAAHELPPPEQDAVLCDLAQLRGLCAAMVALDVPPLGLAATGREFHAREPDLHRLIVEVTARFRPASGRLIPIGTEPEFSYYRRYIPGGLADPNCYCAVGVVGGLASEGRTPFWLRYHRKTSSFREVADRIMASRLAADARGDGGHIWLPLRVSEDRSGAAIIDELADGIETIRAVAAGSGSA